ncbi:hypothetical protein C5S31_00870 [ANME-1 cluster archaeon GoMg2]|nr:hypothetical protein [ANME-1 cluster archaeon GoMg2]
MAKNVGPFVAGLVIGLIVMGVAVWTLMPGMMITVHESKLGFEETVSAINGSAIERGWTVPKIYDIQTSLKKAGHEDMTRVKILSICQPDHAYSILKDDTNKKVTAIMPCRIGVYETADGRVFISEMNMGLMSKMFGGTIAEVMGGVAEEEKEMLRDIIQE